MGRTSTTERTPGQPSIELRALAEQVDTLRGALDIPYRALAERVGIDHARLYKMLVYRENVRADVIGRAMVALGELGQGRL